ncbi:hypothetical protein RGQ15_07320 [Paracoccus sp. MBLB3053]|uniref:MFS transporter n=1 Tax=Paracoccus aurantius TaxID=3073814 RepID=A0ABU2HQS9_9RHOB|nr:hypothetical protein [Paracoccus sp. MBLB3053]MDS9467383.1 hypothetical protein [Paracoccus sp. MBLB3053]
MDAPRLRQIASRSPLSGQAAKIRNLLLFAALDAISMAFQMV